MNNYLLMPITKLSLRIKPNYEKKKKKKKKKKIKKKK